MRSVLKWSGLNLFLESNAPGLLSSESKGTSQQRITRQAAVAAEFVHDIHDVAGELSVYHQTPSRSELRD